MDDRPLCPYKYALGIPGKGFHATRVFGLALYDILGTIALAVITWLIWRKIPFWKHLAAWFITGEVLHWAFGTDTAFLKMAGISPRCQ